MKIFAKIHCILISVFIFDLNFTASFETITRAQLLPDWTTVANDPFTLYAPSGITNPVISASFKDKNNASPSFFAA